MARALKRHLMETALVDTATAGTGTHVRFIQGGAGERRPCLSPDAEAPADPTICRRFLPLYSALFTSSPDLQARADWRGPNDQSRPYFL